MRMSNEITYSLNDIKKNASDIDAEDIHLRLKGEVESGQYGSYLEALVNYLEENGIEIINSKDIKKYVSPSLRGILEKEAIQCSMMKQKKMIRTIDMFF